MSNPIALSHVINSQAELNQSYLPFIQDGGLFIPTQQAFDLDDQVILSLQLPSLKNPLSIEGKVVWIIPKNALHYLFQGIAIQFTGKDSKAILETIKENLDSTLEVSGFIMGIGSTIKKI